MKHEVPWNKYITDCFLKYGNLSEEEIIFMRYRCSDRTEKETCEELNFEHTSYYRMMKTLKRKYDMVRIEHPELDLPKRELIKETSFEFYNKENAIDMINHIDFNVNKIEIRIIKKKKR